MPERVAVLTDSISCLTRELVAQYDIGIVPFSFYVAGKSYRDWVDVTPSEAYRLFLKDPNSFKSTAISPGRWLEAFREAAQRSRSILCIVLSSRISASYDAALEAKELAAKELPGVRLEVLDSTTCATAEGLAALAAAREADAGKDLAACTGKALEVIDRIGFLIFLDTMRYVYRTGRLPRIVSQAGSILNVKPILTTREGALHMVTIVRSKQAGIEQLLKLMKDRVGSAPVRVALTHAYAPEDAEVLNKRVASEFNCVEVWTGEFSPLMGYACGTGALGLAFYRE